MDIMAEDIVVDGDIFLLLKPLGNLPREPSGMQLFALHLSLLLVPSMLNPSLVIPTMLSMDFFFVSFFSFGPRCRYARVRESLLGSWDGHLPTTAAQ